MRPKKSFSVFLPSDGDEHGIFPENTRGEFTIPLAKPIDCTDVKRNWQVALTDITIPTTVYNITKEMDRRICLGSFRPNPPHDEGLYGEFVFPAGQYTPQRFVETFNVMTKYINMWSVKAGGWGPDAKEKGRHDIAEYMTPFLPYEPTQSFFSRREEFYRGRKKKSEEKDQKEKEEGGLENESPRFDEEHPTRRKRALIQDEVVEDPLDSVVSQSSLWSPSVEEEVIVAKKTKVLSDVKNTKSKEDEAGDTLTFAKYRVKNDLAVPRKVANRVIGGSDAKPTSGFGIEAEFNEDTSKMGFKFNPAPSPWIWIPGKPFRYLLGFDERIDGERIICPRSDKLTTIYLHCVCNLNYFIEDMFVYTDIVDWSRVGSIESPLLDVINISEALQSPGIDSKQFHVPCPKYTTVIHQTVNKITIRILDSVGNHFGFNHGRVRVGLHFRET